MASLQTAAAALVERYREDPQFSARTLLVTVFGDALQPHGGEAWIGSLARLMAPLDVNERLTRTSLNRLVGEGLLATRRVGRNSYYGLTPAALVEFRSVEDRIYHRHREVWDGQWVVVVELENLSGPDRGELRQRLRWLGFAGLSPGVMVCPADRMTVAAGLADELGVSDSVAVFRGRSGPPGAAVGDRRLAELSSGLDKLEPEYRAFVERFAPLAAAGRPEAVAPETAFCTRVLLVHAYRRITLVEPDLPAGLWPDGWIGDEAYDVAATLWHRLLPAAEEHLAACCATTAGTLAPLDRRFAGRFPAR